MALLGWFGRRRTQEQRIGEMMNRLDVDAMSVIEGPAGRNLATASVNCRFCDRVGTCEAWLDGRSAGKDPYAFCPNAELFAQHRRS